MSNGLTSQLRAVTRRVNNRKRESTQARMPAREHRGEAREVLCPRVPDWSQVHFRDRLGLLLILLLFLGLGLLNYLAEAARMFAIKSLCDRIVDRFGIRETGSTNARRFFGQLGRECAQVDDTHLQVNYSSVSH